MNPVLVAELCLASVGAVAGVLISRFSAHRSMRQPMPFDLELEQRIVARAHDDNSFASMHVSAAEWFIDPTCAAEFAACAASTAQCEDHQFDVDQDVQRLSDLALERAMFPGACGYETIEQAPYLVRGRVRDGAARRVTLSAAGACTGALAAWVAPDVWAAIAIMVLGLTGWVIAAVDHDTMFLDISTWVAGSAVAGVFAAISGASQGGSGRVLEALIAGLAWWGLFEAMNWSYKLVRGQDGMGGGDGMIAFPAAFVAVAITGSLPVALWSILSALALSLAASAPLVLMRKRGGRDAFALGPFLASGWQLALFLWALRVLK